MLLAPVVLNTRRRARSNTTLCESFFGHRETSGNVQKLNAHGTPKRAQNSQLLDLFWEESWRRVYAGELEVRPPGAPTIQARLEGSGGVPAVGKQ
jgi:hypothetical protein